MDKSEYTESVFKKKKKSCNAVWALLELIQWQAAGLQVQKLYTNINVHQRHRVFLNFLSSRLFV